MSKQKKSRKSAPASSSAAPVNAAPVNAEHEEHEAFELAFWGDCCNTHWEEGKHFVYAARMGLTQFAPPNFAAFCFDAKGASVLDIGGGPTSMLLKTRHFTAPTVVLDPLEYPKWVYERYKCHGVLPVTLPGERAVTLYASMAFDEAWIYNCLQHTDDPAAIVRGATRLAKTVRMFEWVDMPPTPGHPQTLTADKLRSWLGVGETEGTVEEMNEGGCVGRAFWGVFGEAPKGAPRGKTAP